ncbi:MAG: hypothetical protein M3N29_02010 [Chloroflexota bacterium]|nr:hypothetical protein [Chloroflexota bacterium]
MRLPRCPLGWAATALLLVGCTAAAGADVEVTPAPVVVAAPTATPVPQTIAPDRTAVIVPSPRAPVAAEPAAVATRVVVAAYAIDLPVIAADVEVEGNDPGYPLCDVAQYLIGYRQPGEPGTTYLYAHAQKGMFLPLLEASERDDGQELLGSEVVVYTEDALVHRYEVFAVRRHATDYLLADSVRPGDRRLILQTSEGPRGTVPKLQIGARYVDTQTSSGDVARPSAAPRACP